MGRRAVPIRRQLMTIILLTSGIVVGLIGTVFVTYEFVTFRRNAVANIETLGQIVARNSTAALAFMNPDDAEDILSALAAERQVLVAALYDADGVLFASYPATAGPGVVPAVVGADGYRFAGRTLSGFQPVVEAGDRRLGTLYLGSDLSPLYARFGLYGFLVAAVMLASLLVAYVVSRRLQEQISRPILALAETADAVSSRRDYSVRAQAKGGQELELLTGAFNHMLEEIQAQHRALADSEQRARTVLDSALSAVVVMDRGGRIVDWNSRAEAMFGWTRGEVVGQLLADTIVPERYREAHSSGLTRYLASGETRVLGRLQEMASRHRDGREIPVELFVAAIRNGDTVSFCGFITDITARREAQDRLQIQLARMQLLQRITRAIAERQDLSSIFQVVVATLEEKMPVDFGAVLLLDPGGESFTVRCLGPKAYGFLVDRLLIPEKQLSLEDSGLGGVLAGKLLYEPELAKVDFPMTAQIARAGIHSLVAAPLVVEGRTYGVLVVGRCAAEAFSSGDCEFLRQLSEHVALATHEAELYAALQQAYNDLRQSQGAALRQERLNALGQMASGIAHDINNAISPVSLYAELLLESGPEISPRARGYLTTIHRAIRDIANTVSRLREFSRPQESDATFAPLVLNELLQEVIALTEARWRDLPQERGVSITLTTEFAADLPVVPGAANEVRDALTNLIFNAVDAMPDGGELTLRTRRVGSDGLRSGETPSVIVEVADSGTGMSEEVRQRCLEPFFTTKGARGTGLGLAMVYGMVQRHHGNIEIDSEPGRGTTVRLLLPVGRVEDLRASGAAGPEPQVGSLKLLLVDDDPLVSEALEQILLRDGHRVVTTSEGEAAIGLFAQALAEGDPFSVVITDLGMPHMDGRKVAAAIKHQSPSTPVILLTGWGQRILEGGETPDHVDRVLGKPPKLKELRSVLATLTGTPGGG